MEKFEREKIRQGERENYKGGGGEWENGKEKGRKNRKIVKWKKQTERKKRQRQRERDRKRENINMI